MGCVPPTSLAATRCQSRSTSCDNTESECVRISWGGGGGLYLQRSLSRGSLSRERGSLSKGVFQSLGCLSRGVSVKGVSVQGCVTVWGSLSRGSFSRESLSRGSRRLCLGGLCPGGGVCPGGSVWGVSVQEGNHCPGGFSVRGGRGVGPLCSGVSAQGGLCQGDTPRMVTSG